MMVLVPRKNIAKGQGQMAFAAGSGGEIYNRCRFKRTTPCDYAPWSPRNISPPLLSTDKKRRGCSSLYRDRHTSITCRALVVSRIDPCLQVFTMPGLTFWKHWEQRYGMHSPHPPRPHLGGWTLTLFPDRLPSLIMYQDSKYERQLCREPESGATNSMCEGVQVSSHKASPS